MAKKYVSREIVMSCLSCPKSFYFERPTKQTRLFLCGLTNKILLIYENALGEPPLPPIPDFCPLEDYEETNNE